MFAKKGTLRLLAVPFAVLALSLASCGSGGDGEGDSDDNGGIVVATATKGGESGSATKPSGGGETTGETITVKMTDNIFTPDKITVPVNKPITFIAKNEGAAVHNMHILSKDKEGKDFSSDALVNPEKESKFTATFKNKGTYKFQCDYHLPAMAGTIEVK